MHEKRLKDGVRECVGGVRVKKEGPKKKKKEEKSRREVLILQATSLPFVSFHAPSAPFPFCIFFPLPVTKSSLMIAEP